MNENSTTAKTVRVGDEEIRLKFSVAAFRLAALKHHTAFSLAELTEPGMDLLPRLAWVSMLPHRPDLTEEEAMVLLAQLEDEGEVYGYVMERLHAFATSIAGLSGNAEGAKKGKAAKGNRR